jgi:hypothetical protein
MPEYTISTEDTKLREPSPFPEHCISGCDATSSMDNVGADAHAFSRKLTSGSRGRKRLCDLDCIAKESL